jgi:hypothetical protein
VNVVGTAYEQIFEVGAGAHAGWDAYEGTQPAGFLTPKVSYRTNNDWERNLAVSNGAVRVGGVTTFTTTGEHRMQPGRPVTIAGVADPSFNGSGFVVTTVLTSKKFTVEQDGPDAASGGGVATNPLMGGCVAGGAFLDRSGLPPEYQGNLIFGDYNTGRIGRVVLDPALNRARRFEMFGEGFGALIDFETGPDGDLYFVTFGGSIRRVRYRAPAQGIVVSRTHVRLAESGSVALGVRLATQPAGTVQVRGERESGDTDLVAIPSVLTFGPENWDVPRALEVRAAADLDSVDDTAMVSLRSADLTSQRVTVRVTDDDVEALLLSSSTLEVEEGGSASVEVSLSASPPGPVVVRVLVESGDEDVTLPNDELAFDASNWSTPQTLEVEAAADDDASNDGATLRLEAAGFGARTLAVTVLDDELLAPSIVSEPVLVAVRDAPYVYQARAEGRPDPAYSLDEAPAGMDVDRAAGLVTWTPTSTGLYTVALRASNGVEPEALQEFEVEVLSDQAPECRLTQPREGDVLRGTDAEFYGDVVDDVGALRAEFRIDGELAYTDETPGGHFHLGGEHHLFDTTQLADGRHELALVGHDTQGQTCIAEVTITVANETEGGGGGAAGASSDAGSGGVSDPPSSAGGSAGTSEDGRAGSATTPSAGATSEAGAAGSESGDTSGDGGCGCRAAPARAGWRWLTLVVLARLLRGRTRTKQAEVDSIA